MISSDPIFGIIGLGYVGLPVAVAFAQRYPGTIGFDISTRRIEELGAGRDVTGEVDAKELAASGLELTADPERLRGVNFFIVAVPTPIDAHNRPNLEPLRAASRTVGRVLQPGAIVCYESTVYPGVTEEVCGPLLEEASGLVCGQDFKLAYSPERRLGSTEVAELEGRHEFPTRVHPTSDPDDEADNHGQHKPHLIQLSLALLEFGRADQLRERTVGQDRLEHTSDIASFKAGVRHASSKSCLRR